MASIYPRPTNVSTLSVDSYLATFTPEDTDFLTFIRSVTMLKKPDNLLNARKIESHIAKLRKRLGSTGQTGYKGLQKHDRQLYKSAEKKLDELKTPANVALQDAINDPSSEQKHYHAMEALRQYFDAGIDAAKARLNFMGKYPNAYDGEGHQGHMHWAQTQLDDAKKARRDLNRQKARFESHALGEYAELVGWNA
ncbi:hypothetical protein F5Y18DRAFT_440074 [Xylariaceae sp. FL1019]|nr:hypothetical protein F5Y18DRAFT_440074 [Xylariaceae sp. FL1019]